MTGKKSNLAPLRLHIPEPKFRPGDEVDFSDVAVPAGRFHTTSR
jgi:2-oxoisovalerate dehydrogenase E1 component alpha subunit